MNSVNGKELQETKKKIIKVQILGIPGGILLLLGGYGILMDSNDVFHPLLNNQSFVYSCFGLGLLSSIWEVTILMKLWFGKVNVESGNST